VKNVLVIQPCTNGNGAVVGHKL